MLDLLLAIMAICLVMLLLALNTDSDDDNSGGGLLEPTLVPIPIKDRPE